MLVYYFRYTDEIYLVLIQTTKVGLYNECNDILKMTFSENYSYKRIYKEMKKNTIYNECGWKIVVNKYHSPVITS